MGLPSLQKTWEFGVNVATGNTGAGADPDNADVWVKIKDAIIGLTSGHWTVAASSDGAVHGNADTNDNWNDYTDINWNTPGNPHGWMVLENSATGVQVCMDCNSLSTGSELAHVYTSPGGLYVLSGLTTSNRPVAADELEATGPAIGWGGDTASYTGRIHVLGSDDGACTRVIVCRHNAATGLWLFDELRDPVTPWTHPRICTATGQISGDTDYLTYGAFNNAAQVHGVAATQFDAYLTSEMYQSSMLGQQQTTADSQSGAWPMSPMGVATESALNMGRKGTLYDMWWSSTTRSTLDTYPSDSSRQFVQFSDMIFPWNGSVPLAS
jgi:hypothetical protein